MARKPKSPKSPTEITSIRHKKDTRVNIPTEELRDFVAEDEKAKALRHGHQPLWRRSAESLRSGHPLMQPSLPFDSAPAALEPLEPVEPPEPLEPLFVRHPRARRYVVSVRADGVVRVTLPRWGSLREARAFAGEQQPWIERQRRRLEKERAAAPPVPEAVQREAWARARRELPLRLLSLAAELGLSARRVSVRNQKWRWGSCSRSGHICLNWRLVDMPGWVRDYVMIHELIHLRRMDHSRRFWKLVAAACPDYERARAWLRANRSPAGIPSTMP